MTLLLSRDCIWLPFQLECGKDYGIKFRIIAPTAIETNLLNTMIQSSPVPVEEIVATCSGEDMATIGYGTINSSLPGENGRHFAMMTSSNGNMFRVTGPLGGEFTGPRWIPLTKAVTRSFGVFFDLRLNKRLSKQSRRRWFETPSRSLWRHCDGRQHFQVEE